MSVGCQGEGGLVLGCNGRGGNGIEKVLDVQKCGGKGKGVGKLERCWRMEKMLEMHK